MDPLWHIELFGGLRAVTGEHVLTRFRSQKTGALLAYLAFYPHRPHPRDLLLELLWPGEELHSARMKLRTALASLRRQLEPPGIPHGTVLLATRLTARLNPAAISTDVAAFEAALERAAGAAALEVHGSAVDAALTLARGPLLPGYYEPWILPEQQRLSDRLCAALERLVERLEAAGDLSQALVYAGRAVALYPLREEAQQASIRLYAATGQSAAARRQYEEFARLLQVELGESPSPATRALIPRLYEGDSRAVGDGMAAGRAVAAPPRQPGIPAPGAGIPQAVPAASTPTAAAEPGASAPEVIPTAAGPTHVPPSRPLPLPPTRFFGREAELARIRQRLVEEGVRLLTLTGPGGAGKTRLALEAADRLREALAGAVWFVPLADLADPARLLDAIHTALGLPRLPAVALEEQAVAAFAARPALLILDNLEHLLPGAAPIIRDLLARAPLLQCLVTSRQVLELAPEREIFVGPLPVPGLQVFRCSGLPEETANGLHTRTPEHLNTLVNCESVALFVDRAQRVRPHFQLTARNAAAVAELCRRLEGIPLALELAAARTRELSPAHMLRQIECRLDLLVTRKRDLPSRHQTLRAAIEWSYQLLDAEAQRVFAPLYVFRGGFTPAAAAAVCDAPEQARRCLALLHDHSLIQSDISGTGRRFRLLEALREYAAEQLSPDEREVVARRHADYFLLLAEATNREMEAGPSLKTGLDRLATDHDNLRAAMDWSLASGSLLAGFQLAASLDSFWHGHGHLSEAYECLSRMLESDPASVPVSIRAQALASAASFAKRRGDFAAAQPLCEAALEIWRRLGDERWAALCLLDLGSMAQQRGQYTDACSFQQQSLKSFRARNDVRQAAIAMNNLGLTLVYAGGYDAARPLLEEALAANEKRHDALQVSFNLNNLALLTLRREEHDKAQSLFCRSLRLKLELGNRDGIPYGLEGLAELAAARGQMERAVRLFAAADAVREAVGHPRNPPAERRNDERLLQAARVALGPAQFDEAWSLGRSWTPEEAVAAALAEG